MLEAFEPIWGEWYIDEELGQGSFGTVYSAHRKVGNTKEWCAIKHISIPKSKAELNGIYMDLGCDDEQAVKERLAGIRDQLIEEYIQMKQFKGQTNVVSCEDVLCKEKENMPGFDIFIRMELLECVSDRILRGRIDREQTIKLGIDICNALTLLRRSNIVHRDVKPQNIFVNQNGDYKLGDFGTAKSLQGTSAAMSMRGTFAYVSPEAMRGEKTGYTSDIYSLGLVMYRLLNGNKSPFLLPGQASTVTQDDAANMRRAIGEELPPPANADRELGLIVLKACAYDPKDRWQTASDMRNALEALYYGTFHRSTEKSVKEAKMKNAGKIAIIAAACLLVVVGGVFGIRALNQSSAYNKAVQAMADGRLEDARADFAALGEYKDAAEKITDIDDALAKKKTYDEAEALVKSGDYEGAAELYEQLADYEDAAAKLAQVKAQIVENQNNTQYVQAEALEDAGDYTAAIEAYTALGDYGAATARVTALEEKIENYKEAQLQESLKAYALAESYYRSADKYLDAEEKALEMKNLQMYEQAGQYADERKYEDAIAIYTALSETGFSDSASKLAEAEANQLKEADYQAAVALKGKKQWNDAIDAFTLIEDYHDSKTQIQSCYYEIAKGQHASGKLSEAKASYELAGDYSDAAQKVSAITLEIQYQSAAALEAEGKYDEAIVEYTALGTYSDAAAKVVSLNGSVTAYADAQLRESIGDYALAETYYKTAKKYKDAESKVAEMKDWQLYDEAQGHMESGELKKAIAIYEQLSKKQFAEADEKLKEAQSISVLAQNYDLAKKAIEQGDREEALKKFAAAVGYSDAKEQYQSLCYSLAQERLGEGKRREAFYLFLRADTYQDALVQARMISDGIMDSDQSLFAVIAENGMVMTRYAAGTSFVFTYKDIDRIAAGNRFFAMDTSGRLITKKVPWNSSAVQIEVESLPSDLVSFDCRYHAVGIRQDGTVWAASLDNTPNTFGELNVQHWEKLVSVKAGNALSFGLKEDGTVVLATNVGSRGYNVTQWKDIVAIAADMYLVGLQENGKVVSSGNSYRGAPDVSQWSDIVAIDTAACFVAGLKRDGTVVIAGGERDVPEVKKWRDIVAISITNNYLVGLRKDGTLAVCVLPFNLHMDASFLENLKQIDVLK